MEVGGYVVDGDSDQKKPAVVIEVTSMNCSEWSVTDDDTVSDLNPGYPEDDTVVLIAFEEDLDSWWREWRLVDPADLFDELKEKSHKFYAFPESRLSEYSDANKANLDAIYRTLKNAGYSDVEVQDDHVLVEKFGECRINDDFVVEGNSSVKEPIERQIATISG